MAAEKPEVIIEKEEIAAEQEKRELKYERLHSGETLTDFAKRHHTTIEEICKNNSVNPDFVFPNQWFFV